MSVIRLDIEYDGTDFAGWAKQPGLPSIEGALEDVLRRILQHEIRLSVAGRTDAGVHARGQVASFRAETSATDTGKLRRSANKLLPPAIVIKAAAEAPSDFDARHSATSRTYSYSVLNRAYPSPFRGRFVHHYAGALDRGLLDEAAALIAGHHDFTAFTPTVTEHTDFLRDIIRSQWLVHEEDASGGTLLAYWITAPGFLRNMVRVLVGTMLEIGRGYRPLADLSPLLEGSTRPEAGKTAPPGGLCLERVDY